MGHAFDTIKEFFQTGGPFMYVNLVFSAVAIAIIIERTIALFRASLPGAAFMAQLIKQVREGQIDRAMKLCAAAPNAALARVLRSGLSRRGPGSCGISPELAGAGGCSGARRPWFFSPCCRGTSGSPGPRASCRAGGSP